MSKNYKKYKFIFGLGIIFILIIVALISCVYLPNDPNLMDMDHTFLKSFTLSKYILGCDNFGRCILSRIMFSTQSVVLVSFLSVLIGCVIGSLIGVVAGLYQGHISIMIMRIIDGMMAFPGLLLSMLFITVIGRGRLSAIVAISIFMIVPFARISYQCISDINNRIFVKAAKTYGLTGYKLFLSHYLPILLPKIIVSFSSCISSAIGIETSLSFLGLGVQAPNASFGLMLSEAKQYLFSYPYLILYPSLATIIIILGFNSIADFLGDYFEE